MLARILRRLSEQRLPRPPGTKYIRQCDQPNKDHDPTGNPCESNHGRLPTGLSPRLPHYLRAHVQAPWRPRGDDMEAGPRSETRAVSARTLQGMARVRSGQAPAWPLVSGRRGCRGSSAQGRVPKMVSAERLETIFGCP